MNPFMQEALIEAKKAAACGEVPIGAVLVKDKTILVRAHNLTEKYSNPLYHAEFLVMQKAITEFGLRRLTGCSLYVTLEPCTMCGGAILLARPDKVYFGAYDPAAGACGGKHDVLVDSSVEVYGGIMEQECCSLLTDFFQGLRN